jgi:hypothetical protein
MRKLVLLVCVSLLTTFAAAKVTIVPVPDVIRSDRFAVTIDGKPASFAHAAANYYFLNFDLKGKALIVITAPSDDYWANGVEVQPRRENIRPALHGRTISFVLDHPAKLSISRPGDHLAGAEMLFLFANSPEDHPPKPGAPSIRYYGPGVYKASIDAHSGDTIYLAPGAVILGSLNLWGVQNVKVSGRGVIIYDGPQDPNDDTGWRHLRDWHAIVMENARNISVSGITCVVRSRTWMIQMKDSRFITFDNVKVIGGDDANANQDGMDWLGGGDTVVHNSFIRAADDVFAMQSNWEGYDKLALPGHEVSNITIENSVLSTSISNVVRAGWPGKDFNSSNFVMRDSDVIHAGIGACGIPFALLEFWEDQASTGSSSGYRFENIRLDDWYSLVQLRQPNASIHDVVFRNIWALETPSLEASTLLGQVSGVSFDHVRLADRMVAADGDIPARVSGGADEPSFQATTPRAAFTYSRGAIHPGDKVRFDASPSTATRGAHIRSYQWSFGDGTTASGRRVRHKLADAEGTLWNHSGRFRVTLKITDDEGKEDWLSEPVVVASSFREPDSNARTTSGLKFRYYEGTALSLTDLDHLVPLRTGVVATVDVSARSRDAHYALVFDGYLNIPADGGYTFSLLARDEARLELDGTSIAVSPKPFAQVCGSAGNAAQLATGSVGLRAGRHAIRVSMSHTLGENDFALLWQGPGIALSSVPAGAFRR